MPRLKDHSLAKKEAAPRKKPAARKKPVPYVLYSEAIADEICERLAAKESLESICRSPGMPHPSAVIRWVHKPELNFKAKYETARNIGYHLMAEELLAIADDGSSDYIERVDESGRARLVVDHDHIARSRLKVETRKWILCHMLPKLYGDKVTVGGDENAPIQHNHAVSWMTKEEAAARGWA